MQHFLYDISQRFENLREAMGIADDMESVKAIAQALQGMECEISETVYNGIGYIKNLEALANGMADEIERLRMKHKAVKKRIQRIRDGYCEFMEATGQKTVKTERGSMTVATAGSRPITVVDKTRIPEKYMTIVPAHLEPSMPELRRALRDGEDVPGVEYGEARKSLRIS